MPSKPSTRSRDLLAATFALSLLPAPSAGAQRYFFADRDPVVIAASHGTNPADYMQLFAPNAPWPESAAKVWCGFG